MDQADRPYDIPHHRKHSVFTTDENIVRIHPWQVLLPLVSSAVVISDFLPSRDFTRRVRRWISSGDICSDSIVAGVSGLAEKL